MLLLSRARFAKARKRRGFRLFAFALGDCPGNLTILLERRSCNGAKGRSSQFGPGAVPALRRAVHHRRVQVPPAQHRHDQPRPPAPFGPWGRLFFEIHNAKKSMAFNDLHAAKGYNRESLASGGSKKKAGYALAVEWVEWNNVAESVILTARVNNESAMGQLLPAPPVYQGAFAPGAASWLKFSNYLDAQLASGHTASYDPAAAPPATGWLGKKILAALAAKNKTDLEITANEMAPTGSLNTRATPFTWELLNPPQLT